MTFGKAILSTLLLVTFVHVSVSSAAVLREVQHGGPLYNDMPPSSWTHFLWYGFLMCVCLWKPFRWFPLQAALGLIIGIGAAVIFYRNNMDPTDKDWWDICLVRAIEYDLLALLSLSAAFIVPAILQKVARLVPSTPQ